jgi:hypothetical protein
MVAADTTDQYMLAQVSTAAAAVVLNLVHTTYSQALTAKCRWQLLATTTSSNSTAAAYRAIAAANCRLFSSYTAPAADPAVDCCLQRACGTADACFVGSKQLAFVAAVAAANRHSRSSIYTSSSRGLSSHQMSGSS